MVLFLSRVRNCRIAPKELINEFVLTAFSGCDTTHSWLVTVGMNRRNGNDVG
jgi:hypothetical protein